MADEFDAVVAQVLEEIGPDVRDLLENLAITVEPDSDKALGAFIGTPRSAGKWNTVRTRPAEIVLYENPIRQMGGDLRANIHDVLLHEIGHYLGLTHGDMGATIDG